MPKGSVDWCIPGQTVMSDLAAEGFVVAGRVVFCKIIHQILCSGVPVETILSLGIAVS